MFQLTREVQEWTLLFTLASKCILAAVGRAHAALGTSPGIVFLGTSPSIKVQLGC